MNRYTLIIGPGALTFSETAQRPVLLRSLLLPVGWELLLLRVGMDIESVRPEVTWTEGPSAKMITPQGEHEMPRASYVRYVLDRPRRVMPGEMVQVNVRTPIVWGECEVLQ